MSAKVRWKCFSYHYWFKHANKGTNCQRVCFSFVGKCAHSCVGNDTCACFKGYKLKPDGSSCEGKKCPPPSLNCNGFICQPSTKKCNTMLSLLSTISESLLSNTPRYQRVFAGSRKLPGRRALHQHRGLVPLPERGQLWDWLWAHWQQQLQRSVKLTSTLLCNGISESCLLTVFSACVPVIPFPRYWWVWDWYP